jgi:hypothetical protein
LEHRPTALNCIIDIFLQVIGRFWAKTSNQLEKTKVDRICVRTAVQKAKIASVTKQFGLADFKGYVEFAD